MREEKANSKDLTSQLEKANAVHEQKVSFYETQLAEAKMQQEDSQRGYESLMLTVKNLEEKNENSNIQEFLQKQRTEQLEEMQNLELKYKSTNQQLSQEIEELVENNNKLELKMKISVSELEKENEQYTEQLEELKKQNLQLTEDLKQLEEEKLNLVKSIEDHYKEKVERLEAQLDEKNSHSQETMEGTIVENQKQLEQLKEFYDEEKLRLENRLIQEKEAGKQRLDQQKEEFEERLREEEENHEEELYRQLDQERGALISKIEYLENALEEARKSSSESLEKHLDRLENERLQLKEALENDYGKKKLEIEDERQGYKDRISNLEQQIDLLNKSIQDLKDELMTQKLDFAREEAMISQRVEFKEEKISELQAAIKEMAQDSDEKIKALKNELYGESQERLAKLDLENNKLIEKLELKTSLAKELETALNKTKGAKEREAIIFEQKIDSLEVELNSLRNKYDTDINGMSESHKIRNEELEFEIQELSEENNDMKVQLIDLERDFNEISSNYERDKALWDDKFEFLENQKNQAKRDLQDAHQKFEMTVEQLQRKDSSERGTSLLKFLNNL